MTTKMLTQGPAMMTTLTRLRRLAPADLPVLITGETGTGKELAARAVHEASNRADAPFVALNCGALSPHLVESELFGHERGAFTGADETRGGLFEAADGGTLFLDEIGELPLALQPRLLRVLETLAVRRVGGVEERVVDVRIVAATHRDLTQMVEAGRFRADLYHRLAILSVTLPRLDERREDIPLLARHFVAPTGKRLTADALEGLEAHHFPGNVRELRNVILRAALLCTGDTIDASDLELDGRARSVPRPRPRPVELTKATLDAMTVAEERAALESMIAACGGNRARVARRLGIGRSTLHARLLKLGIPKKLEQPAFAA